MTRFENVGIFIREKVWLEPNLFPYKYKYKYKYKYVFSSYMYTGL